MSANVEALNKVLNHIRKVYKENAKTPDRWNQEVWASGQIKDYTRWNGLSQAERDNILDLPADKVPEGICGTSFCFAGYTGLLFDFPKPTLREILDETTWEAEYEGNVIKVSQFAREYLQLDEDIAEMMFEANNSFEDLEKMVEILTKNPDISYDDFEEEFYVWKDEESGYLRDDDEDEDY